MIRNPIVAALAASALAHVSLPAQSTWSPLEGTSPAGRRAFASAYDEARNRLVLFSGETASAILVPGDLWEWDGSTWDRIAATNGPSERYGAVMAYDAARQRTVLFGGIQGNTLLDDTWEWDGSTWTEIIPASRPSARSFSSLVFDTNTQKLVLFGGDSSFGGFIPDEEIWEFDGTDWVEVTPAVSGPGPRAGHAAAYDESRQRMVVYGGNSTHDVWEWDGASWFLGDPAPPFAQRGGELAYDRTQQLVVLYGGTNGGFQTPFDDTWTWNGTRWQSVAVTKNAGPRGEHHMVFDSSRNEVVLLGGIYGGFWQRTSSLAAFDGTTWTALTDTQPSVRLDSRVGFDGNTGRPIAFGGQVNIIGNSNQTYTFDGTWQSMPTATTPPARLHHAFVFDRARGKTLMVGGTTTGLTSDTWSWDGADWTLEPTAPGFEPREFVSMAYDELRERVILFGGGAFIFAQPFGDTWSWDGTQWTELFPANSPAGRKQTAMAYDPVRDRIVLFGGGTLGAGLTLTDETWEFDGTDWIQRFPATVPGARAGHEMVYDPIRERVVMYGANFLSGGGDETWEWDGNDWTLVSTAPRPPGMKLVFDEARGRTLGFADYHEAWEFVSDHPPAYVRYGTGCGPGTIGNEPLEYPVIGREFTLVAEGNNPLWPAAWSIGSSNTDALGAPLEIALDFVGMEGCFWLQSGEINAATLTDAFGVSKLSLTTPVDLGLLGFEFHAQAFVLAPSVTTLGWTTTEGYTLRFGR